MTNSQHADLFCHESDFDAESPFINKNFPEVSTSLGQGLNEDELLWLEQQRSTGELVASLRSFQQFESSFKPDLSYPILRPVPFSGYPERSFLVDRLLQMASFLEVSALSSSLAVNYLDRYLSLAKSQEQPESKLDLLSIACLSIACKMDETFELLPNMFQDGLESTPQYDFGEVMETELSILKQVDWKVNAIVPLTYVSHLLCLLLPLRSLPTQSGTSHREGEEFSKWSSLFCNLWSRIASYLTRSLLDFNSLKYRASVLASAAVLYVLEMEQTCPKGALGQLLTVLNMTQGEVLACKKYVGEVALKCDPTKPIPPSTPQRTASAEVRLIEPVTKIGAKRKLGVEHADEDSDGSYRCRRIHT